MTAVLSVGEFARRLARAMGADDVVLDPDRPLSTQVEADSVRMVELAIALEQEFGLDLPDDLDLRQATVAGLYDQYTGVPHA
jgi:acyl carrier protein